jgi:REP-associated tyrosine transposase
MGETPRLQATPSGGLRYDARRWPSIVAPPTPYSLHYHFVLITKYRKPVLVGDIGTEVRDLIREICRTLDVEILQGHVRPEHVHLLLSVPPHLAPSRVMQAIKGKTSHHLLQDHRRLRAAFWGRHLWARGYFVGEQRERDRRRHCPVHQAARCRARGRRPLSRQRDVSLHGAAMASSLVDFSRPRIPRLQARVVQAL